MNLAVERFFYKIALSKSPLRADLFRCFGDHSKASFLKALRIPGFRFLLFYRLANATKKYSLVGAYSRLAYRSLFVKYGFQIPRATKIGGGFKIEHFGGIVVNMDAVIGWNCTISPGVIIGKIPCGNRAGSPIIGDRVWIGAGAVVVGGISIGSDVVVAPNAFINFDVPSGSLVLGNPAVIKDAADEMLSAYMKNMVS